MQRKDLLLLQRKDLLLKCANICVGVVAPQVTAPQPLEADMQPIHERQYTRHHQIQTSPQQSHSSSTQAAAHHTSFDGDETEDDNDSYGQVCQRSPENIECVKFVYIF